MNAPKNGSKSDPGGSVTENRSPSAPVMEVFASFQGEGLYLGEPQIFVRLRGCPLRCPWCDTPGSWRIEPDARARIAVQAPADGDSAQMRPMARATPFQVACWIAEVERGAPRTISVTGGEPLMWPEFVRGLCEMAGDRRVHLETAGAHPNSLARVVESVDHVSLDLKLPAEMGAVVELDGEAFEPSPRSASEWRAARRGCLELIAGRDACAKLVLSGGREAGAYEELLCDLARIAPKVPLFVQPVTPVGGVLPAALSLVGNVVEDALDLGLVVRVVPQMHRVLGIP
ncbi:MAG TPA: 7-carboxy-7-deazaguanine synthase QueE [Planctomycetota bacterium]|nr:7-carboxy-7-deazaguanine synthase QueE [Planctomycetota bacterium]